jgi:soluble lytic murein transglycosylase-like protein
MSITTKNKRNIKILFVLVIGLSIWNIKLSSQIIPLQNDIKENIVLEPKQENPPLVPYEILDAIIMVESGGNEKAYNKHTGAVGLTQLTPIIYSKVCGLTQEEAFQPKRNIACASLFLRSLMDKYNGNLEKSLGYYNNGHKGSDKYVVKVKDLLDK